MRIKMLFFHTTGVHYVCTALMLSRWTGIKLNHPEALKKICLDTCEEPPTLTKACWQRRKFKIKIISKTDLAAGQTRNVAVMW